MTRAYPRENVLLSLHTKQTKSAITRLLNKLLSFRGVQMRHAMKRGTTAAYRSLPPTPQRPKYAVQPRYHHEISDEQINQLQQKVDSSKPEGFALTPLSDSGW